MESRHLFPMSLIKPTHIVNTKVVYSDDKVSLETASSYFGKISRVKGLHAHSDRRWPGGLDNVIFDKKERKLINFLDGSWSPTCPVISTRSRRGTDFDFHHRHCTGQCADREFAAAHDDIRAAISGARFSAFAVICRSRDGPSRARPFSGKYARRAHCKTRSQDGLREILGGISSGRRCKFAVCTLAIVCSADGEKSKSVPRARSVEITGQVGDQLAVQEVDQLCALFCRK